MAPVMAVGIQAGNMKIARPIMGKKSALIAGAAIGWLAAQVKLWQGRHGSKSSRKMLNPI